MISQEPRRASNGNREESMSNQSIHVKLGDLLSPVSDGHIVHADQSYSNFGIYSFGRGLFHKPPISGTATSAKVLYRVKCGQFIYSRLFAFEGAYGLVSSEFDGHYVSNEYPTFDVDNERILSSYLALYFKSPRTWEQVARLLTGMGDRRRRIQPEQLLTHQILLPPLHVQERSVNEISKIQLAITLHAEVGKELDVLYHSMLTRALQGGE